MKIIIKYILLIILLMTLVVLSPWLYLSLASLGRGYSFSEMDWNEDGHLSFDEFLETADIEKEMCFVDGKAYIKYWSLKTGLTVKITSSDNSLRINKMMINNEKEYHPEWQILENGKILKVED